MPVECRQHWGVYTQCQAHEGQPSISPNYDDGSDRYIAVECDIRDAAAIADKDAHTRHVARNILRRRRALTYLPPQTNLMGALEADRAAGPNLTHEEQRCCSEWHTTATPPSFDESDGWVEPSELLNQWPPEGCDRYRHKRLRLSGVISATAIGRAKH
eukprot:9090494-Pyramimonas_sp.AAC.1